MITRENFRDILSVHYAYNERYNECAKLGIDLEQMTDTFLPDLLEEYFYSKTGLPRGQVIEDGFYNLTYSWYEWYKELFWDNEIDPDAEDEKIDACIANLLDISDNKRLIKEDN